MSILPARTQSIAALALAVALLAPLPARADGVGSAPPPPPPPPAGTRPADELYATAYREIGKAKQELAEVEEIEARGDGDQAARLRRLDESAHRRLAKAVDRLIEVVKLSPAHADAWNMLGYSLRMTGRIDDAFQAYWKCLDLDPGHPGAHEYLGETHLAKGDVASAVREQEWLKQREAPEAATLARAIVKWRAAHPGNPAEGGSPRVDPHADSR